jgi:O-succinylbenzoate synthase
MKLKATYHKHTLQFLQPAGTSRGTYTTKDSWFIFLTDDERTGIGECSILRDLSIDDRPDFEEKLNKVCTEIAQKLTLGFSCIKLKIGAIDWKSERQLIADMRKQFSSKELTIRVDANGAYTPLQATEVLHELAQLQVHSIEQPIKAGQWDQMAKLCESSPIPIALDEELIGIFSLEKKHELLKIIKPNYLILKPGLLGGFKASDEWITLSEKMNIGWWATSALESNIGLNSISQWVFTKNISLPQGLGTGMLFSNNIDSPLKLKGEKLYYNVNKNWGKIENGRHN